MKLFTDFNTAKLAINRFPPGFHWVLGNSLVNFTMKKIRKNSVIYSLSTHFRTTHSNLIVVCAEHTAESAVSRTAPVNPKVSIFQPPRFESY